MKTHPSAIVETNQIGAGTSVWAFVHIMANAKIGSNVNIGDHSFIESGAVIGNNVTIKNQVCIWDGITIEDDVFLGPRVTFTNDRHPRSPRMPGAKARYAARDHWLCCTVVRQGCSVGAGATIGPGIELGPFSMIGAGAVVTKTVPPFALVTGVAAQHVGDVCRCGRPLTGTYDATNCNTCGETALQRLDTLARVSRRRVSAVTTTD